jgi:hypothetical protein
MRPPMPVYRFELRDRTSGVRDDPRSEPSGWFIVALSYERAGLDFNLFATGGDY